MAKSFVKNSAGVLGVVFALALAGCSSDGEDANTYPDDTPNARAPLTAGYVERPVEDLYNEALDELSDGIYRNAAAMFDEVERQHPYSSWARRAMLMSAYAHYLDKSYDLSILSAERFLALHPGNKHAPYAHYLIAICYYEQITDVGRDQKTTELALATLLEVVRRYPDSEYARDARLKIDLTRDHLAGKEMEIGRYYLFRGQHVAAINRFTTVLSTYQTTTHVPEALHRLVEANLSIGLAGEAQTAAAVLGFNYPGSEWYEDTYALMREANLEPFIANKKWIGEYVTPEGRLKAQAEQGMNIPEDEEGRTRAAEQARDILYPPMGDDQSLMLRDSGDQSEAAADRARGILYGDDQPEQSAQDILRESGQSGSESNSQSEATGEPEIIVNEVPLDWTEEQAKPAPTDPVDIQVSPYNPYMSQ